MTWFLLLVSAALAQDTVTGSRPAPSDKPAPASGTADPAPPADVEPGSKLVWYEVKSGDTMESIANTLGFLPEDLRRWNQLGAGEPAPGTRLQTWVAPGPEPEPAPVAEPVAEEPEKKKKKEPAEGGEADEAQGVGFFVGLSVGPAFSISPLKPAVSPRLELGLELPPLDRSFRIFVSGQYLRPAAIGSANDDRVPGGSFDYDLRQDELSIAFGPAFRAGMLESKVKPEVSVGPNVYMYRSTVNGEAGGAAFPESREQYTRVGIFAAAGIGYELGPGELTVLLSCASSGLNGVVTGESNSLALSPLVGYRFVF